jgi:hypothetical protein
MYQNDNYNISNKKKQNILMQFFYKTKKRYTFFNFINKNKNT